jgi:hypothetical protein
MPDHLMASIARPGGTATAVTCMGAEQAGKRVELLKEFVLQLVNIAALYNPGAGDQNITTYGNSGSADDRKNL